MSNFFRIPKNVITIAERIKRIQKANPTKNPSGIENDLVTLLDLISNHTQEVERSGFDKKLHSLISALYLIQEEYVLNYLPKVYIKSNICNEQLVRIQNELVTVAQETQVLTGQLSEKLEILYTIGEAYKNIIKQHTKHKRSN